MKVMRERQIVVAHRELCFHSVHYESFQDKDTFTYNNMTQINIKINIFFYFLLNFVNPLLKRLTNSAVNTKTKHDSWRDSCEGREA